MGEGRKTFPSKNYVSKVILIIVMDLISVAASLFLGLWLRFDFSFSAIPTEFVNGYLSVVGIWCGISVVVFSVCRLYSSIWVFVSTNEALRCIVAYLVLAVIAALGLNWFGPVIPTSSCFIGMVISFMATVAIRFAYRLVRAIARSMEQLHHGSAEK